MTERNHFRATHGRLGDAPSAQRKPGFEQVLEESSQSVNEDCGRCGASLEWLIEKGCPFGSKTTWCPFPQVTASLDI